MVEGPCMQDPKEVKERRSTGEVPAATSDLRCLSQNSDPGAQLSYLECYGLPHTIVPDL